MNKLMIGIPVKDDLICMQKMIDSLLNSTKAFDYLYFVDGGSTDGTIEWLQYISKIDKRIKVHQELFNGPIGAYNVLFKIAKEQESDLFITQTDVIFPKKLECDWLMEMKQIAQDDSVGAIIPWNGGNVSGPDYIDGFYWLGGWATYYTNKVIQKIGGYDTNFPSGYGVDIDHTYRLIREGLKIVRTDYWVNHHQMNNREHDRADNSEQMKQESSKFFKEKYGLVDRQSSS